MAAALLRRGTGSCARDDVLVDELGCHCLHRELCRVVWRSQTALFSSKQSDRQQPRRTHIKKAKPQPALDVAKLLEQLFSQSRPGSAPPVGKAQPTKASSTPTKPFTTSSMKVSVSNVLSPLSLKPISVSPTNSKTSHSSETPQQSPLELVQALPDDGVSSVTVPPTSTTPALLGSDAAAIEWQTSAETIETNVETVVEPIGLKTATKPLSSATVEPSIQTTTEPPVEPIVSLVGTLEGGAAVVEGPVEPTVDVPAEEVQTKGTDSGVAEVLETTKENPSLETAVDVPVETIQFPVETVESRVAVEGPVEPMIDVTVDTAAETISTNSGVVDISHTATVEPLLEKTGKSVEVSTSPLETSESRAAVVESPVELAVEHTVDATVDAPAQVVQTNSTDSGPVNLLHIAEEEPLIETTTDTSVEVSASPLKNRTAEVLVETTIETEADTAAQAVQTSSPDSGIVILSHIAEEEPLIETTIDGSVEASTCPLETPESGVAVAEGLVETEASTVAQAVQTESTDLGPVNISYSAKEESLIQTITEPAIETSTFPLKSRTSVPEGTVEPVIENEAVDNISHIALIQHAQECAPLPLKNEVESTLESTVGSSSGNATMEEGVSKSEQMSLESVTLDEVKFLVESLKNDEFLQTKSTLDEKVEQQLQELFAQTGTEAEHKAAAETENSSENESEILTEALSKWDSLSEDLRELEGESGVLVKELLCHVPAVLSVKTSPASDPHVGANGESLQMEKDTEAEAMTLESITLSKVKAEVGGLETEVLLETRNALEKEADILTKEEKMEVKTTMEDAVAVFEDTIEAEILTVDYISETTDAIEAETSVMLEAMFGSEQGPKQLPDTLLIDQKLRQQDKVIDQEAEKEPVEQEESVREAMTLESVTLAEIEASLGTLENESLSETSDYLEKEADILTKEEKMEVKTTMEDAVAVFENTIEAEILTVDSISETTDAIEAETSVMLEAMFGSEQGPKQPLDTLLADQKLGQQDEVIDQEAEKEPGEQEGSVREAMTLESVTLAEIEASLGTLENESLSETSDYLEKEAEILAGEQGMEVEDGVVSEETTEALGIESLSLPDGDALSEALHTDALMEELLFSVPGHVTGVKEHPLGQEDGRANTLDATVAIGSVDVDSAAAVMDDFPAAPALTEVVLGQEVKEEGAQTEALGNEDGEGAHTDLDPVQRLFLEKIKEYNNMRRLKGGLLEVEPDYEKHLSEETAKLQRLYGGGDLSSFPDFTFAEPKTDQDSK